MDVKMFLQLPVGYHKPDANLPFSAGLGTVSYGVK